MVDKKKKIHRSKKTEFKKGHKFSVGKGRPPMTPEQKAMSFATRTDFKLAVNRYMSCTIDELNDLKQCSKVTAFDKGIIQSLIDITSSGSHEKLIWFINQVHGKEKETTNINLTGGMENSLNLKKLSKEELLTLQAIAKKNETK